MREFHGKACPPRGKRPERCGIAHHLRQRGVSFYSPDILTGTDLENLTSSFGEIRENTTNIHLISVNLGIEKQTWRITAMEHSI